MGKTKTSRKLTWLVHIFNDEQDGPLAAHATEGRPADELYRTNSVPSFMRYVPKNGKRIVYEEIYIPDDSE